MPCEQNLMRSWVRDLTGAELFVPSFSSFHAYLHQYIVPKRSLAEAYLYL